MTSLAQAGLKLETFNAGLAHGFVPHAKERISSLIEAVSQSDADVICLQEVWEISDRNKFFNELQKKYPHTWMTPVYQTTTSSRPSCKPWQILGKGKFVSCMSSQCSDAEGDEFSSCIIEKCSESLERLKKENRQCASALMAKVGKNPIASLLELINPFYRSGLYAYRGSNGLMLLSKLELKDKKVLDFSDISTLNRRQALSAKIVHNGDKIALACTHLSAQLNVPYTGLSRNWADENYAQAIRLLEELNNSPKAAIMGDLNCGLADEDAGLSSELEQTCQLLNRHYQDPLLALRSCTYCEDNLLTSEDSKDVAIDHILTKGLVSSQAQIKYSESIELQTNEGPKASNLSDHYGFQITID